MIMSYASESISIIAGLWNMKTPYSICNAGVHAL